MDLKLKGRTALVTGASKGIGLAVARRLAEEGCHVHLAARSGPLLKEACARIAADFDVKAQAHIADLSVGDTTRALADACADADILVNNAGAIPGGTLQEIAEPRWREAWDLKVFGYINLTRAMYAHMAQRRRGVIVNIIGAAGERMDAAYIAGSTGNAGLAAFTRALGGAAPKDGLRVVGIHPGATATERLVTLYRKRAQDKFGEPERWKELTETLPFGRPGTPEEIAALAAFLASDWSAYTTGCVITVDGGSTVRSTY
jgi:NAD(P)-dependent dehydrogenase (short-subunit alcohol dehydrogenase family)